MEHGGIDVHKKESQICLLTEQGEILEPRIVTRRDRFAAVLGNRPRARLLIEASTESEWVARGLEELGHEVIVADPNYAPMYAARSRRIKTDRRDAAALMEACRLGAYRPAHRTSDTQRQVRALLVVRDNLVRARVRQIQVIRALTRREGLRIRSGEAESLGERLRELTLPAWLERILAPVVAAMDEGNQQLAAVDQALLQVVGRDPVVQRLDTAPGVGVVTAVAFVATLDQVERFEGAHQVECYLGLVPSERSSGERQHRGQVTKAGNARMRWLLVEAAWGILRSSSPNAEHLRAWAERIAMRRGRSIAAVALARRLAGILYAMWRDGTVYDPQRRAQGRAPQGAASAIA
jgi:transposase